MTDPGKEPVTSATSSYVPTASVSGPSSAATSARRWLPKPYPLPLATGTISGTVSRTERRCPCQRSRST